MLGQIFLLFMIAALGWLIYFLFKRFQADQTRDYVQPVYWEPGYLKHDATADSARVLDGPEQMPSAPDVIVEREKAEAEAAEAARKAAETPIDMSTPETIPPETLITFGGDEAQSAETSAGVASVAADTAPKRTAPSPAKNKAGESTKTKGATKASGVGGAAPARASSDGADDLKKIKGVGKVIEGKLHDHGITRFAQIAAWTKADVEAFNKKLSFSGRIEREEWIAQAKDLAG